MPDLATMLKNSPMLRGIFEIALKITAFEEQDSTGAQQTLTPAQAARFQQKMAQQTTVSGTSNVSANNAPSTVGVLTRMQRKRMRAKQRKRQGQPPVPPTIPSYPASLDEDDGIVGDVAEAISGGTDLFSDLISPLDIETLNSVSGAAGLAGGISKIVLGVKELASDDRKISTIIEGINSIATGIVAVAPSLETISSISRLPGFNLFMESMGSLTGGVSATSDLISGISNMGKLFGPSIAAKTFILIIQNSFGEEIRTDPGLTHSRAALKASFLLITKDQRYAAYFWFAYKYKPDVLEKANYLFTDIGVPLTSLGASIIGALSIIGTISSAGATAAATTATIGALASGRKVTDSLMQAGRAIKSAYALDDLHSKGLLDEKDYQLALTLRPLTHKAIGVISSYTASYLAPSFVTTGTTMGDFYRAITSKQAIKYLTSTSLLSIDPRNIQLQIELNSLGITRPACLHTDHKPSACTKHGIKVTKKDEEELDACFVHFMLEVVQEDREEDYPNIISSIQQNTTLTEEEKIGLFHGLLRR